MNDFLLFVVLPYLALGTFFLVTIQRYRQRTFSYSSLSSQFLENKQHFWGSVPFHYGLLFVLGLHLAGLFIPNAILSWNAEPARLFITEITGLAMAVVALVGVVNVIVRRFNFSKARRVTTTSDWVIYLLLVVQIGSGIYVAIYQGWGSSWFATNAVPWLWSLFSLQPDVSYIASMPLSVKVHVVNAFLLIGFFPFTRLVHVLVVPNHYLWRRTQVVLWNRDRRRIRQAK
ncbi:MAG: respiratory nitrate reductase subunit gamma [Planctomycetota bacterium]|jgi:nitrate reductase gamma subunit|nr:respiratory nitrate reductase subunit gamma [Planctomycetota bacterium]MDP6370345.1 respiratory nitrate reductase subunit gamma [Planctomycetota bacterium]MDP6839143.1 respiratory nitrate reductase subunit gamma [Planctomycetota bacterium]